MLDIMLDMRRENHFKFAVDTQVVQSEEDERVSAHVYV